MMTTDTVLIDRYQIEELLSQKVSSVLSSDRALEEVKPMVNQLRDMDYQQTELYSRIQAFSLDQSNTQLSFSRRLARDNGWSIDYARRAIKEYKKFVFLAVSADHPVTPSDQVDQVWHLHLTYTRSYWQEFCPKVLQATLHHDPTRGGSSEQLKFDSWYSKTLESYQQFFGHIPPTDI